MIRFSDFLPVPHPDRTKVKFNMRAGTDGSNAWDLMTGDDPEQWLDMNRHREKNNSNNNMGSAEYLLAFAQYYPYGAQYFIFGGAFRVTHSVPEIIGGPGYDLELLDLHSDYIQRLIVKLQVPVGRNVYLRKYETLQASELNPEVYELAPEAKLGTFPGYNNVRLKHHELQRIVRNDEPSWKDALSSVKGVYVITDTSNGRLYVGSASGEVGGLWQRWSSYANLRNLTGGNKELLRIRDELGDHHIVEHFQYSIIEIFDPKTRADTILVRESFWKKALDSRVHGMNAN